MRLVQYVWTRTVECQCLYVCFWFLIQVSSKLWGLIFLGVVNSNVNDVCELGIHVE